MIRWTAEPYLRLGLGQIRFDPEEVGKALRAHTGRVQLLGRAARGIAGPGRTEPPCELLGLLVPRPGERVDPEFAPNQFEPSEGFASDCATRASAGGAS